MGGTGDDVNHSVRMMMRTMIMELICVFTSVERNGDELRFGERVMKTNETA